MTETKPSHRHRNPQPATAAFRREPPPIATIKLLLNTAELARSIGVSPRTVDNWVSAKRIPVYALSPRMRRFSLERVLAALDRYELREIGRN